MKKLHFSYKMTLTFSPPVKEHRFTIKCTPQSNDMQKITELKEEITPRNFSSKTKDSFGNLCVFGYADGEHSSFSVSTEGVAETGLSNHVSTAPEHMVGIYKYQTPHTAAGAELTAFHSEFNFKENTAPLEKAKTFMNELSTRFAYVQGVTGISTTAEQAWELKEGVCQDYSHILISLCRMEKIPARYVVGMLMGEGLSHAWVEVWQNGYWVALDPTNKCVVDDCHIKISCGRDYKDCLINQGIFTGKSAQRQDVGVTVTEI